MTLTIQHHIEQGTDEWLDQRRGLVTASAVGKLITPKTIKPANNPDSNSLTLVLAAERITGFTEPVYVNADMQRGHDDEPVARNLYHQHYAPVVETGFMTREFVGVDGPFEIGYSPDGLVGDDGLIEIKSRRQKTQLDTILANQVPAANMAQLQCGLLVSGREWIDYISYCAGMPLYVTRVTPDMRWFDSILAAVEAVERDITNIVTLYREYTKDSVRTQRYDLDIVIA